MTSTEKRVTPARLETAREGLILRQLTEGDAPQIQRLVERNQRYLRQTLNWLDLYDTPDGAQNFIHLAHEGYESGESYSLVMELHGQPLGYCGFRWLDVVNRNGEIHYWIDESAQGQGLVTTSCQRLLNLGFDEWGLHRICFTVMPSNTASKRVIARLGAQLEGVMRGRLWLYDHFEDLELHSILASDR